MNTFVPVSEANDDSRYLAPGSQNWHNFPTSAGAPRFFVKGKGPLLTDTQGRQYIDVYSGSGTVILGHADDYQIDRVKEALNTGATVSLRHPIEAKLAARLVRSSPGAEFCHFFKTGSEAVHAAMRICVNQSERTAVATTGFHGWLLPFGPRRKVALDKSSKIGLTGLIVHTLDWLSPTLINDFERVAAECACIIVTPSAFTPSPEIMRSLFDVAERNGTLVIFDEVKAAYRYSYPNVTTVWNCSPHLRVVSKGLANGFPISAILGNYDLLGPDSTLSIFSTYASEVLSMTAAMACLDRLEDGAYHQFARASGQLKRGLDEVGAPFGVRTAGIDTFFRLVIPEAFDVDRLCRELSQLGVLYHPHDEVLIGASHDDSIIASLLEKFSLAFKAISHDINTGH